MRSNTVQNMDMPLWSKVVWLRKEGTFRHRKTVSYDAYLRIASYFLAPLHATSSLSNGDCLYLEMEELLPDDATKLQESPLISTAEFQRPSPLGFLGKKGDDDDNPFFDEDLTNKFKDTYISL
ncbi:hypothetical protein Fmac_017428 [Flemingia macrophylla]|uniref:Uncharacterized protein n=1 Tax=Flemingia macrophylla TaxID=520843 RepID=A0ABD1M234_9FABA